MSSTPSGSSILRRIVITLLSLIVVTAAAVIIWLTIGFSLVASLPLSQSKVAAEVQLFLLPLSVVLGLLAGAIAPLLRRPASLSGRWSAVIAVLAVLGMALNIVALLIA
jgi:hypothetical protein